MCATFNDTDGGEGESRGPQGVEARAAGALRHPDNPEAERADGGQGGGGARPGREVRACVRALQAIDERGGFALL